MMEYRVVTTTIEEKIFDENGFQVDCKQSEETIIVTDNPNNTDKNEGIDYNEYINSPKWNTKKRMALKRDNWQCQKCGSAKNLNVHHITYEHLGNEPLSDLVTLCKDCHKSVHDNDICKKEYREYDFEWYLQECFGLLEGTLTGRRNDPTLKGHFDIKSLAKLVNEFARLLGIYQASIDKDEFYIPEEYRVEKDDFEDYFPDDSESEDDSRFVDDLPSEQEVENE